MLDLICGRHKIISNTQYTAVPTTFSTMLSTDIRSIGQEQPDWHPFSCNPLTAYNKAWAGQQVPDLRVWHDKQTNVASGMLMMVAAGVGLQHQSTANHNWYITLWPCSGVPLLNPTSPYTWRPTYSNLNEEHHGSLIRIRDVL